MAKKGIKSCKRSNTNTKEKPKAVSYRLKCRKRGGGLSHYIIYDDVAKNR